MRSIIVSILCVCFGFLAVGQSESGYEITIHHSNDSLEQLLVGYHFGNKQYVVDTLGRNPDDTFVFKGEETLTAGVYLIITPPENTYTEIILDTDQYFTVHINHQDGTSSFTGSEENTLFREHTIKMQAFYEEEQGFKQKNPEDIEGLKEIGERRAMYQKSFVDDYKETLVAALVRSNIPLQVPEMEGEEEVVKEMQWQWFQEHFFDYIDLSDARLVRSPVLLTRLDYYFDKLIVPHPDSIIVAADKVIDQLSGDPETFKYGLSHIFNKYATSDIVGMDAVSVHLIDKYYSTPAVDWIDDKKRSELRRTANKTRPLLLGKTAPDFVGYKRDSSQIRLHDVEADFTVLYFWAWDCGHCKKSMPDMIDFYNNYKDKGVELFAACTKTRDKAAGCWDMIDEKGMDIWINVNDPELISRFVLKYDITSTPQLYILDKDKKIIMKKIGANRLPGIMDYFLNQSNKSAK